MIRFRPIKFEDLPLRSKWLNDPETNKYLGSRTRKGTSLAFHKKWFEKYLKDKKKKIFMILCDNERIGQVGLVDINKLDKNAHLYIVIGEKNFRGKGVGREAMDFIINYGFNKLKLHKILLEVHADNIPAVKLYESSGFQQEGRLIENVFSDGKYKDEIIMSLRNNE